MTRKTDSARSVAGRNVERLLARFGREPGRLEETLRRVLEASRRVGARSGTKPRGKRSSRDRGASRAAPPATRGRSPSSEREAAALYEDLRSIAAGILSRLPPGELDAEALVTEFYLDLTSKGRSWTDRDAVLGRAARVMRGILIEDARRRTGSTRCARRRLAPVNLTSLTSLTVEAPSTDLIEFDDALRRLAEVDERAARVAEHRVFGALTCSEIGRHLNVSLRSVELDWEFARRWLTKELSD